MSKLWPLPYFQCLNFIFKGQSFITLKNFLNCHCYMIGSFWPLHTSCACLHTSRTWMQGHINKTLTSALNYCSKLKAKLRSFSFFLIKFPFALYLLQNNLTLSYKFKVNLSSFSITFWIFLKYATMIHVNITCWSSNVSAKKIRLTQHHSWSDTCVNVKLTQVLKQTAIWNWNSFLTFLLPQLIKNVLFNNRISHSKKRFVKSDLTLNIFFQG
jgi:hypothetical protein